MLISDFLQRCEIYRARRQLSRARLSTILFNDGKKLDALAGGADVGVRTLEKVTQKLSALERALSAAAHVNGDGASV